MPFITVSEQVSNATLTTAVTAVNDRIAAIYALYPTAGDLGPLQLQWIFDATNYVCFITYQANVLPG